MMEGAYFVSRTELLQWVNGLLHINIQKVEQCASGAVYCQILDACAPGSVAMRKVNWMAKSDHEFIPNYKVLQAGFDKNAIVKHIEVDKLIRAKYQDNLEFLQWMKCHWDRSCHVHSNCYDPVKAREGRPLPPWARDSAPAAALGYAPHSVEKENLRPPVAASTRGVTKSVGAGGAAGALGYGVSAKPAPPQGNRSPRCGTMQRQQSVKDASYSGLATTSGDSFQRECELHRENEELRTKASQQTEEISDLKISLDGLEQERDYYFKKLREVEILMTTLKARMDPDFTAEKMLDDVQRILYDSTEGEAGPGPTELSTSW